MPSIQPIDASCKMRRPPTHPTYSQMILDAIGSLKERGGSSRQAILSYIMANFRVGTEKRLVNHHLKMALRASVERRALKQKTGSGAVGSFSLGDTAKKDFRKTTRAKAKKAKRVEKTKAARRLSFSAFVLTGSK